MSDEFEPSPYQPEEAFAAGQSHAGQTFAGQPLRAFSYSRKLAAQSMGCIAPGVIDFAEHMRSKGTYPGALSDTIIVTWLCTLRDNSEMDAEGIRAGEWTPERARNRPGDAQAAADKWAEANQIDNLFTGNGMEAWKFFLGVMFAIDASVFEVGTESNGAPPLEDSPPPKTLPGHPKKRSSSRGSHGSPGKASALSAKR